MDINTVKVENNLNLNVYPGSLSFLNPRNWFKIKLTKENVNILFIDDLEMPAVANLKRAGYKVRKIRDVKDIDSELEIKNANIIFVDFDGVYKSISPKHQGAALAKAIKDKFQNKKYVVLYTAQPTLPTDTIMRALFESADARLRKDSDVMDFTEQIRLALQKLR